MAAKQHKLEPSTCNNYVLSKMKGRDSTGYLLANGRVGKWLECSSSGSNVTEMGQHSSSSLPSRSPALKEHRKHTVF